MDKDFKVGDSIEFDNHIFGKNKHGKIVGRCPMCNLWIAATPFKEVHAENPRPYLPEGFISAAKPPNGFRDVTVLLRDGNEARGRSLSGEWLVHKGPFDLVRVPLDDVIGWKELESPKQVRFTTIFDELANETPDKADLFKFRYRFLDPKYSRLFVDEILNPYKGMMASLGEVSTATRATWTEKPAPVEEPYLIDILEDGVYSCDPDDENEKDFTNETEAFNSAKRQANKTGEDIPIYKKVAVAHPGKATIERI